jgi:hypothetical protein
MVKGVSRQVIVVHSPDPKLFEQAIFILKDDVVGKEGVTDELLLKEAQMATSSRRKLRRLGLAPGLMWAGGGAAVTALVWIFTALM